ncbi:MAG: isoaspartyl peptidase/L-asparaginase [Melioribacteraceae bacterium]|nr:isoaspartyl peptidase/L-asparaginase [Melioribacteraceae bacterium]
MNKKILIMLLGVFFVFLLVTACTKRIDTDDGKEEKKIEFGLVVHGGAGYMTRDRYTPEQDSAYRAKLTEALSVGYKILKDGGTSLECVEKVINILEDSPLFNAGKGAVTTEQGEFELDASIMYGKTNLAGAVAGVKHIKNPISLAKMVMENSKHVMLAREGAEIFAEEQGIDLVDQEYFSVDKDWYKKREKPKSDSETSLIKTEEKFGTVGCAALDKNGDLAAGTSTGGMQDKKFGRIGDSPIIGAGTYAENNSCAVSATGHGEFFIRNVVCYDIAARMKYLNETLAKSADEVVMKKLKQQGGDGGIISIDKLGNIEMVFNTSGMFRGYVTDNGEIVVKIYEDE